ncbi:hypothetical protein ADUPG1_009788 [Aduncisulcus paluster]|uniref:Uncharacterized protein n=1 Tax=Aduncisulcus paluster TaxID=2918883 RepID=A0ABQ5KXZ5_9EUKA|nr:hypothetical protein ADUPG1_009788 [Aduncisulcus paluster]
MSELSPIDSHSSPSIGDLSVPSHKKKTALVAETPKFASTLNFNIQASHEDTSKHLKAFRDETISMLSKLVPKQIHSTRDLTLDDMAGIYSVTDELVKEEHRIGNIIALKLLTATCKKEYDDKGLGTRKKRLVLGAQRKKQIITATIRKSAVFGRIYEKATDAELIDLYKARIAPFVQTAKGNYRNKKHAVTLEKTVSKYKDDLEDWEKDMLKEYATCKDWSQTVSTQSLSQSSGLEEESEETRAPSPKGHRISIFKTLNEDLPE